MSRNLTWAAVIAVSLLVGTNAMAADPPPTPDAPATASDAKPADALSRVLGSISAVDLKAKSITLSGFGGNDTTVAYDDNTKFMLDIPATTSDIKLGDTLRAFTLNGGNAVATGSVSPDFLNIVPLIDLNEPPFTGPIHPVVGIVTTLNPLTITTADKTTITINIVDHTRLSKSKDATVANVTTGTFGSAIVKGAGTGRVLTELHIIQPPHNN